jgi:hypothetical protein
MTVSLLSRWNASEAERAAWHKLRVKVPSARSNFPASEKKADLAGEIHKKWVINL